ncbi:uncharacterized protein LOC135217561 [Macrobrachium nipponense]|uniref:uncharacterized protein LOC135217561 n=1 Tax=Macrobrachium nipponense TaxID=159736 RepID=UPI0030C7B669
MKVHLFGAASSPGCANYGFRSLAKKYEAQYPQASKFVCQNFYVDDGVTCVPSVDEATKLVKETTELCCKGGLRLHKFISNDRSVMENIPISECASKVKEVDISANALPVEAVLGLQWSLEEDMLTFSQSYLQHPATCRGILSAVASLFDPLVLIAPYILKGKRILQEMCRRREGWDDPLPCELNSEWETWKKDQEGLHQFRIPRCYHPPGFNVAQVELHHFSDASTMGYGQCSYLRLISLDGKIHCCLVTGKSRVTPTKVLLFHALSLQQLLCQLNRRFMQFNVVNRPSISLEHADSEQENIDTNLAVGDPEVRSTQVLAVNACISPSVIERLSRFSRWSLVVRAIAHLKRLASSVKGEHLSTVAERRNAEIFIIKEVPKTVFAKEVQGVCTKSSSLQALSPYVDNQGVLRVGRRLEGSTLPEEIKHPAIILKNHALTRLIIGHLHEKVKHQGRGMTINEIRSHGLWIVGMSKAVASYIYKCATCRKSRRPVEEQKMANLPEDQIEDAPPFTFSGMDCFGPFLIKERRKCYGVLFTCMASRAVHIEMLDDMSTDAFINALRCFLALRGRVQALCSDQGTNFLGAKNEFERGMKELDVARLKAFMSDHQCEFVMNVPHSSHTGGVWERQIRTARSILPSLMNEAKGRLDSSSFRTLLYEVMHIMNSRL